MSLSFWIGFVVIVLLLLALDIGVFHPKSKAPGDSIAGRDRDTAPLVSPVKEELHALVVITWKRAPCFSSYPVPASSSSHSGSPSSAPSFSGPAGFSREPGLTSARPRRKTATHE